MRRIIAVTILGIVSGITLSAHGQGIFQFNNYTPPYVPIVYDVAVPGYGGSKVSEGEGVAIEVWWAIGPGQPESALVFGGAIANWSRYAGYTDPNQVFTAPTEHSTYTAQLRASGLAGGLAVDTQRSRGPVLDVEVQTSHGATPLFTWTPGFTVFVPEPSTFALVGLGAAALLIFRRRR